MIRRIGSTRVSLVLAAIIISLSMLAAALNATPASAIFGLSKCEKTKASILNLEKDVARHLRLLKRLEPYVSNQGPLVSKAYNYVEALDESLYSISALAMDNSGCFSSAQKSRLKNSMYWDAEYYYLVFSTGSEFLSVFSLKPYTSLYSSKLK